MNFSQIYKSYLLIAIFLISSCSSDGNTEEEIETATCNDQIKNGGEEDIDCGGPCSNDCIISDPSNLSGSIFDELTLDSSITYTLSAGFVVESGATLIIPAGTIIETNSGRDVFILIKQGGDLVALGTAEAPIRIGTPNPTDSPWGGLILAGNSITSATTTSFFGDVNFSFGGTDLSDNSGTMRYLILDNAGAGNFGALSLFAVGTGTTLSNIAIFNSANYGLAYFGGTATANNMYFKNNTNRSLYWDYGWSGNQTNSLIVNDLSFDAVVEAFGNEQAPNLDNFTAQTTNGGSGFMFREASAANITGLSLSGIETPFSLFDDVTTQNVQIEGENVDLLEAYDDDSEIDPSIFNWVNQ